MGGPVTVTAADLARLLAQTCPEARIDLAGAVALPCPLPNADRWRDWVAAGRDGDLDYLTRDVDGRTDPTRRNPGARSLLVFAQRYTDGWPAGDPDPAAGGAGAADMPWTARVSRYARGLDYHDVLLGDLKKVLDRLRAAVPGLEAFPSTDTGPYLEREYAWLAGCGFLGHSRCLIHEKLGSGLFLGVALTNLEISGLPPAGMPAAEPLYAVTARTRRPRLTPPTDMCGSCTACLDACPTGALDLTSGLDAHLCLSTWSIEWRGRAPDGMARLQGGLLFGCDICQAVCPWNTRAARKPDVAPPFPAEYGVHEDHPDLTLADLADISDADFRDRFRRTPLWRCHPDGLRRNARRVLANLEERS